MELLDLARLVLDDDERATDAAAVARDVDRLLLQVDVDADELVDAAGATQLAERAHEPRRTARQAEDVAVEVDDEVPLGVDLGAVQHVDVCGRAGEREGERGGEKSQFGSTRRGGRTTTREGGEDERRTLDADEEADVPDGLLVNIGRDVGHEGEVLDEATGFSLGRVARAQHAPLARLERTRSTDLARLLELGRDARHHAERRDERQAAEDVRDAGALHLEPLERPVARRDGAHKALRDAITVELELLDRVKLGRAVGLLEDLVNVRLEVVVELLEQVLEQERQELAGSV